MRGGTRRSAGAKGGLGMVGALAVLAIGYFTALDQQMGAGGDFAAAYVIAHEVAHHVQNELGILPKVNAAR